MKTLNLVQVGLQLRLWLSRFGWSNSLASLLFVLGSGAWLWAVPHLREQTSIRQSALHRSQKAWDRAPLIAVAPALPQSEQRLHNFYDALGNTRYVEQQVKTLFAVAAKNGLTLDQSEYKIAYDKNGRFNTYSILLPVKGRYAAIRPFCEQVLLAVPFASLDEVNFKREAITNQTLEAKLRFTLHLNSAEDIGRYKAASYSNQDG